MTIPSNDHVISQRGWARLSNYQICDKLSLWVRQCISDVDLITEPIGVYDPYHPVAVELFSTVHFVDWHRGVLQLNYDAVGALYVSDMLLASVVEGDDLLPIEWKQCFPCAMPWAFVLHPWIAMSSAGVSPVPANDGATLRLR